MCIYTLLPHLFEMGFETGVVEERDLDKKKTGNVHNMDSKGGEPAPYNEEILKKNDITLHKLAGPVYSNNNTKKNSILNYPTPILHY